MASELIISASAFKAECLNTLDRLAAYELGRVVITKHGRPVGIPLPPEAAAMLDLYGSMRRSVVIAEGFDRTAPILDEPFDAEDGVFHR